MLANSNFSFFPFKAFTELDCRLFAPYESSFLHFLLTNSCKSKTGTILPDPLIFKTKLLKQANFAEKDPKLYKNMIYTSLTKDNSDQPNPERSRMRAYSSSKYDFARIFQYRYYTRLLKRMKKNLFFNVLVFLEHFNSVFNKVRREITKTQDSDIFQEKLVFFFCYFIFFYFLY